MTKWIHKCDINWMKARLDFLTATDVRELIPFTKTGRKRTIGDEQYLKVLSRKLVNVTEDDCMSYGSAARGHILEPYAIDRYNEEDFGGNQHLWHWDDIVIPVNRNVFGSLAFSPDAMDVEPPKDGTVICGFEPTAIGEVKSYSAEKHLICGYTPKDQLEERWQIAVAMAVCPTIQTAYLLFYNPSMTQQLYIVDYDRADLAAEIDIVLDVQDKWLAWLDDFKKLQSAYYVTGNIDEEQKIIDNIIRNEKLNPENEKSVIR